MRPLLALVIFIIILNAPFVRDLGPVSLIRGYAVAAADMPIFAVSNVFSATGNFFGHISSLSGTQAENERLKDELLKRESVDNLISSLIADNNNLRELLAFRARKGFSQRMVAAQVVSRAPDEWFDAVQIDKGEKDGIRLNDTVITPNGLAGMVSEVRPYSSKVTLITDPSCSVSVAVKRTGLIGSAAGSGAGDLTLKYIPSGIALLVGDEIISSNVSSFMKGVTVGRISYIGKRDFDLFQEVKIKTSVDLSRIEKLFVVL